MCSSTLKSQLLLLNPGVDTNDDENTDQDERPKLQAHDVEVVIGLRRTDDGRLEEEEERVAADSVVLPDALGLGLAPVQLRRRVHGEADQVLEQEPEGGDDAKVAVYGLEVGAIALELVHLDRDDADGEDGDGQQVEAGVQLLSDLLLLAAVGGLENEDRLHQHEHAQRLGERVYREQDQRAVEEDGGPYGGDE